MQPDGVSKMKTVLVPVADGVEDLETVTLIDVFRRAGAEVTVASVSSEKTIKAAHGVRLVADQLLSESVETAFDLIVLPGGLPGADHLSASPELIQMLKKQHAAGKLYGAICASPAVVLKPHGLLEGRQATCYPSFAEKLGGRFKGGATVVVDGNCVTSQGPGTAMEFALKLVEVLFDRAKRDAVAKAMLTT